MAKKIILFRHGQIEKQYRMKFIGRTDAPLSEGGRRDIRKFQEYIKQNQDAYFLFSPLIRAQESFAIATKGLEVTSESDNDLMEVGFGEWENLGFMDIADSYPQPYHGWIEWDPNFTYPRGESHQNLLKRIKRCAAKLKAIPHETVIVFTHGGPVRFLLCELMGLAPEHYLAFKVLRGSRTILDVSGHVGILEEINFKYPE